MRCRGTGESPSWAVWRPFTHMPRSPRAGRGPRSLWAVARHPRSWVPCERNEPQAPEVPPPLPLPLFPSVTIHPCVSVCVHLCVSLGMYVSLPPALLSLASPLSAPSYTSRGGSPSGGAKLPGWMMALSRKVLGLSPWSRNSHDRLPTRCQGPWRQRRQLFLGALGRGVPWIQNCSPQG